MEEKLDILIDIMRDQLSLLKDIDYNIAQIRNELPSEVSTSKIERILERIGDVVVNLER